MNVTSRTIKPRKRKKKLVDTSIVSDNIVCKKTKTPAYERVLIGIPVSRRAFEEKKIITGTAPVIRPPIDANANASN